MKKTILIVPFDGPLASGIASEAQAAGWAVAIAYAAPSAGTPPGAGGAHPAPPPAASAQAKAEGGGKAQPAAPDPAKTPASTRVPILRVGTGGEPLTLTYNPASFVSISTLVLAARNALGELDAAVLVGDPASLRIDFAACRPGELGAFVEARCAGPIYLAREIVRRFEARRSGRILLVAPESPRDASPGPAAALAAGAFQGLGAGLFAASAGSAWQAYGVGDASGQGEKLGRFVLGLLEEPKPSRAGRWLRYSGKTGLFGAF